MKEILMEINLLYNKMNEVNNENEVLLGNEDIPFSKVLLAITRGISNDVLFEMSNEELISHIQKIQLIES